RRYCKTAMPPFAIAPSNFANKSSKGSSLVIKYKPRIKKLPKPELPYYMHINSKIQRISRKYKWITRDKFLKNPENTNRSLIFYDSVKKYLFSVIDHVCIKRFNQFTE